MALRAEILDTWRRVYEFASRVDDSMKAGKLPVEDAVDIGYVMNSLAQFFDAARKDCKGRKEQIARMVSLHVATLEMENPGQNTGHVKGRLAIGIPDIRREVQIPKIKDPKTKKLTPEYVQFMRTLGVPEEVIQLGIIKPDWKGLGDYATHLARLGRNPPAGTGKTYTQHKLALRRLPDSTFGEAFKDESDNDSETED
jgi:hypothetical protein